MKVEVRGTRGEGDLSDVHEVQRRRTTSANFSSSSVLTLLNCPTISTHKSLESSGSRWFERSDSKRSFVGQDCASSRQNPNRNASHGADRRFSQLRISTGAKQRRESSPRFRDRSLSSFVSVDAQLWLSRDLGSLVEVRDGDNLFRRTREGSSLLRWFSREVRERARSQ